MRASCIGVLLACAGLVHCQPPEPMAGILTSDNLSRILATGETAFGRPGDFYLRNDWATFVIQRPSREIGPGPYGGSVIDAALADGPDCFGELIPALALGRTVRIETVAVVSDGSDGGGPVVEGEGVDATNAYANIEAVAPEIFGFHDDGSGILGHDPETPINLHVRVRYRLAPDEPRLSIRYTFTNAGEQKRRVPLGFIVDSRADVEPFLPGTGFAANMSKDLTVENMLQVLANDTTTNQLAFAGDRVAVSLVPKRLGDKVPPRVIGVQIPAMGSGLLLEASTAAGAAKEPSFSLDPGESTSLDLDMVLAPTLDQALARGMELLGTSLAEVTGCVHLADGTPGAHLRVGLMTGDDEPVSNFLTNAAGCFAGRVPPGIYHAIAGEQFRPSSEVITVTVPGHVELTVPNLGQLEVQVPIYDQLNTGVATQLPCRVTLVGERQIAGHPALRGQPYDDPGGVIARQFLLRYCASTVGVAPGRYLAFVSRGPEFDRVETVVDIRAGQTTKLSGALHRVVDSTGYAAADFHVHSIYSIDSRVPARTRVLSVAAEGLDFWASTDHDVVRNFTPVIAEMGLEDQLLTVAGSEMSTFALGHFNAFPLPENPFQANGGSPDWGVGDNGVRPTMAELFDTVHRLGGLAQVNHPRTTSSSDFRAYFNRVGLSWDPITGQPFGDPAAQPVPHSYFRYPDDVTLFSRDFDLLEVQNGTSMYVTNNMVYEHGAETTGHDWMNFLSAGQRVVATANSDSHTTGNPPGNPRNLVGGHDQALYGLVTALTRGNVILTTGPMVWVTLFDAHGKSASLGDVLSTSDQQLNLHVRVESPTWYVVDQVEVVANAFFPDPMAGGEAPSVARATLSPEERVRGNQGRALVGEVDIPLDTSTEPFAGRDSWIVVRVGGPQSTLFPIMRVGGGTLDVSAETPEAFLSNRWGTYPYAMTNPVLVDANNDQVWLPTPQTD